MREDIEYFFFLAFRGIAQCLPYRVAGALGSFLGTFTFHVIGFRKQLTLDNLQHAFPELDLRQRTRIALGAYRNYGKSVLEMLWAANKSDEALLDTMNFPDRTLFDRASAGQRGVIFLSAHYGNWELLIHGGRLQLGKPIAIIVQRQRNRKINEAINLSRSRHGTVTIPMGPSSREALKVLQDGGILGMLGDQSAAKEAAYVDFFGRPAATHRGVAAFSLKKNVPVIMAFMVRRSDARYDLILEEVDRSGLEAYSEENVMELTRRHTVILEKYIRLHPDHWLWMHKRWKHTEGYEARRKTMEVA